MRPSFADVSMLPAKLNLFATSIASWNYTSLILAMSLLFATNTTLLIDSEGANS